MVRSRLKFDGCCLIRRECNTIANTIYQYVENWWLTSFSASVVCVASSSSFVIEIVYIDVSYYVS